MPTNLPPAYKKAEQWFRSATTNDEKILALEEMLSIVPKHKGTDHLRADLRRKLSKLKEGGPQKRQGTHVDIFHVPKGGAGQIVLLGTPNCGKGQPGQTAHVGHGTAPARFRGVRVGVMKGD